MAISTVSFTKTPQAGDDAYSYDEDSLLTSGNYNNATNVLTLDVMSNDLGGGAKKLYSIDNGDFQKDLLTNNVNTGWEATANGNQIRIVNGKIEFDVSNSIHSLGGTNINSLTAHDHIHDSFTYAIQLGNGTLSTATVTVDIQGQNDAATISGDSSGSVTEDGPLSDSGALVVNDADHGESQAQAVAATDTGKGSYSVDADGTWHYSLNNAAAQHLGAGVHDSDSFTVTSADGGTTQTVNIDIVGVNDVASIAGDSSGSVTEDGTLSASGTLAVSDVDDGEGHAQAASGSTALGGYSVDADGNWSYTVDNDAIQHLGAGKHASDSFTVDSLDGTAHQTVNIDIVGVNDVASIAGDSSGSVTEDGTLSANGTLAVSDVDDGEAHAQAASGSTALGSYSVDADGNWSYTVDNAAIQHLGAGVHDSDSFTVDSLDGTAHQTVAIDIVGANDAASISGASTGSTGEDDTAPVTGSLTVSDADDGESHTAAGSGTTAHGSWSVDDNGNWSFSLDNASVQYLNTGQSVTDSFTVSSQDGTASQEVKITINGANDAPVQVEATCPPVYTGGGDPNDNDALGQLGSQTINGGNQSQTLFGGAGNDTLNGSNSGTGGDALFGGSGNDTLNGQNGSDKLYGGSGSDTLDGGLGPDTLIGGYGADTITGGNAPDTIRYLSLLDTGDTITDFVSGTDKLDLSAIDANTNTLDINDVFAWGGQQDGHFVLANSVTWFQDGNNVEVLADTDGNLATAEFCITLAGVTNLLVTDFNTL